MTNATHTPFTFRETSDGESTYYVVQDGMDNFVAKTYASDYASLIAAAPKTAAERDKLKEINAELLRCLEGYLHFIEKSNPKAGSDVRNIIAKAKGE